ncbi:MAG: tetratricopeptide repeat protein [Solirubrobacterales bacterium]
MRNKTRITSLRVETELDASRAAVSDGDLELARSKASKAIDILPMSGAPRVQLALVDELDGSYATALAAVDEAIERDPEKSSNYLLKARILLRLGRERAAGAAFERSRKLNPNDPIFQSSPTIE